MTTKTKSRRSRRTNVERRDVHQQVTDNIIAAIEAGVGEWQMPWRRSGKGLFCRLLQRAGIRRSGC